MLGKNVNKHLFTIKFKRILRNFVIFCLNFQFKAAKLGTRLRKDKFKVYFEVSFGCKL